MLLLVAGLIVLAFLLPALPSATPSRADAVPKPLTWSEGSPRPSEQDVASRAWFEEDTEEESGGVNLASYPLGEDVPTHIWCKTTPGDCDHSYHSAASHLYALCAILC
jgi:hypothetical protein